MNVNTYLAKQYENPPCWQLVADVYATERGRGSKSFERSIVLYGRSLRFSD